ncbi:metal transporter [archaeon SCG-AAA382B04]|nr:metal transporter [archaeon SCG-AAA382B04]
MHIPDGYLDLWLCGIFYLLTLIVLSYSGYKARENLDEKKVPLIGVVAAAIFAAQMLNWPIPGGTSAHFVGGALAAILLGPYVGVLSMASVVTVQALMFGDGGILALGANIWNMALIDVFVGYLIFRLFKNKNKSIAAFLAGWIAITAASLFVGIQTGLSTIFKFQLQTTLLIMVIGHGVLGIIEGAITASAYRYLIDVRPDFFEKSNKKEVEA